MVRENLLTAGQANAQRKRVEARKARELRTARANGEVVDLVKIGAGKVWHLLAAERHVEETDHSLALVAADAVCGTSGEKGDTARDIDARVVSYQGASVCSRCTTKTVAAPAAADVPTEPKEKDMAPKTNTTTKVSSREAIRLAFQNGDVAAPATTADICEAAAKYATSLGFNPRHQLEATLHAQARKDDGVVVRAGRGLFAPRVEETAEAVAETPALVEVPLSEVLAQAAAEASQEEAKTDPKPAAKKRTRKPAAKKTAA